MIEPTPITELTIQPLSEIKNSTKSNPWPAVIITASFVILVAVTISVVHQQQVSKKLKNQ